MHNLFNTFAHRYDLHTPPDHYCHDHELVLELAGKYGRGARVLDVGCGTGVLVWKALAAGFQAAGLDASESMIQAARTRVPHDAVRTQRMQALDEHGQYALVVSLSWCVHYCSGEEELRNVLCRMRDALHPGGRILLQVAHSVNLAPGWMEDRECGPDGMCGDVSLKFRFRHDDTAPARLLADYAYTCQSRNEAFSETHVLEVADVFAVRRLAGEAGFTEVEIWNSYQRDAFDTSGSAFLTGLRT
jgi:SAM-dependent methyltransferase